MLINKMPAEQDNQFGLSEEIISKAAHITPSPRQHAWQEMECNAFIHFGMNTFTDRQWGLGNEDPKLFNPTQFDAHQWVRVCKQAGMKMILLTAKHHDGFCLWPSRYTDHSVKNSPWKEGKGDVVKEVSDACREGGIRFGIYLSPWDRHEPTYGNSPLYNEFYKNQLRELMTEYGDITEVWLDGACDDEGIRKNQHYDWQGFYEIIRKHQPHAVIAGMGPDVLVNADETGYGYETVWSVIPLYPGHPSRWITPRDYRALFSEFITFYTQPDLGSRENIKNSTELTWFPTENITSIRPGWFYTLREDDKVKSVDKLLDIYYSSHGCNAVLLLNLPPDRRGLIHENDVKHLLEFRSVLDATFKHNIALHAKVQASEIRDNNPIWTAEKVVDGNNDTYWTTNDGTTSAFLEFDLGQPQTFNRAMLQEYNRLGQRIEEFALDTWDGQNWQEFARAATVGYKRLLRFDHITSTKVRLRITQSRVCPTLSNFGLFFAN
jgi:alpha-L-fucosidase